MHPVIIIAIIWIVLGIINYFGYVGIDYLFSEEDELAFPDEDDCMIIFLMAPLATILLICDFCYRVVKTKKFKPFLLTRAGKKRIKEQKQNETTPINK